MGKKSIIVLSMITLLTGIWIAGCGGSKNQNLDTDTSNHYMRKGPYLMLGEESNSMTVLWQTNTVYSMKKVAYIAWAYTEDELNSKVAYIEVTESGDHQFSYTIKGLTPSNRVYYKVMIEQTSGDAHIYRGSFMSSPDQFATSVSFYAYGDTRDNPTIHDDVLHQILRDSRQDTDKRQTLLLHTGDFVHRGLLEEKWDNDYFYYRMHESTNEFLTMFPIMASVGNHEFYPQNPDDAVWVDGPPLLFRKYWPYTFYQTAKNYYYSFDYGPVHVAVVDVYTLSYEKGSPQYNWLENDLKTSVNPWKLVMFHHPAYAAGASANSGYGPWASEKRIRENLSPLFEEQGIKLVLQGHVHNYSRSVVNGITYLVLGGGGGPLSEPDPNYAYVVKAAKEYHFARIDIIGNKLTVTVQSVKDSTGGGDTIDQFTINAY